MALTDRTIAFIGAGHITNIILENLVKGGKLSGRRMLASDPNMHKLQRLNEEYGIAMARDNLEAVDRGDMIFINVRPPDVAGVIEELGRKPFPGNKLIVTLAAGIRMAAYEGLGQRLPVVRALPNPPSQVGMGIAALAFNAHVGKDQKEDIFELFASLGEYIVVDEEKINAVTALSSPAATYLFFESLIEAGIGAGIDRETATRVVHQTIAGAMEVWKRRQAAPRELLAEASTPGGVSEKSIETLEAHDFRTALVEAIGLAVARAEDLGSEVRTT